MNPVARLTDTSELALLQNWTVVFAVGLGIGGSMLASLLFDWLRPHPSHTTPQPRSEPVSTPLTLPIGQLPVTQSAAMPNHRIFLIGIVLIFAWARRHRARWRP